MTLTRLGLIATTLSIFGAVAFFSFSSSLTAEAASTKNLQPGNAVQPVSNSNLRDVNCQKTGVIKQGSNGIVRYQGGKTLTCRIQGYTRDYSFVTFDNGTAGYVANVLLKVISNNSTAQTFQPNANVVVNSKGQVNIRDNNCKVVDQIPGGKAGIVTDTFVSVVKSGQDSTVKQNLFCTVGGRKFQYVGVIFNDGHYGLVAQDLLKAI
ncbi:MAG: hypothetical protein OHK0017_00810 [Patescibacteria group bacterium]